MAPAVDGQNSLKTVPCVPKEKKVTNLHFFFHGIIGGKNPTAVVVARANVTTTDNSSPAPSSSIVVDSAPLTIGPEPTSEVIGNVQGLENPVTEKERELAVIGGRGKFRMAKGFAVLKTYFLINTSVIVEYNVTVIHHRNSEALNVSSIEIELNKSLVSTR
ncbi:hypothetical protein DITRI_Ditri01bG0038400 [Diplodiscus trichospermus]